jgi:hypothetical protein
MDQAEGYRPVASRKRRSSVFAYTMVVLKASDPDASKVKSKVRALVSGLPPWYPGADATGVTSGHGRIMLRQRTRIGVWSRRRHPGAVR